MTLATIRRPAEINSTEMVEIRRWAKHTTDNIDRINLATIEDANLRDSAALSVIGRSANSAGSPADIAAGTDGYVLRRNGTTLDFGKVRTSVVTGTSTNDAATAGDIGETVESIIASGSAVSSPGSGTAFDVTSISLTAGDWDVSGNVQFSGGAITGTRAAASLNTTSATEGTVGDTAFVTTQMPTAAASISVPIPPRRISIASTTTVYLVGRISYTAGSPTAFGHIYARRAR